MNAAFLVKAVGSRCFRSRWSHSKTFARFQFLVAKIMTDSKPNIVFVLGGPGAGKGTVCSKIANDFKYVHLSAGELLRQERAQETSEYKVIIEEYIKQGKIVPVEVTCKLIENAMQASGENKFLIDGFPRNEDNLQECPDELCVGRCLGRGKAGSGRTDDNEDSLKQRLKTYKTETMPIIEYYQKLNLVKTVDGSRPKKDVYEEVKQLFQQEG